MRVTIRSQCIIDTLSCLNVKMLFNALINDVLCTLYFRVIYLVG